MRGGRTLAGSLIGLGHAEMVMYAKHILDAESRGVGLGGKKTHVERSVYGD